MRLDHLVEMERRLERLDLLHQLVGESLAGDHRNARNVVDRLFRIELGALAADLVENVDEVRLYVEQTQFEHGEQAARARADDQHVGFDRFAHVASFRLGCARIRLGAGGVDLDVRLTARLSSVAKQMREWDYWLRACLANRAR